MSEVSFPVIPPVADESAQKYETAVSLFGSLIAECSARIEAAEGAEKDHLRALRSGFVQRREALDPALPESLDEAITRAARMTCPPDHPHNRSCYTNHECRCDSCRADRAAFAKRRRYERQKRTPPPDAHGSSSTYTNWMCRCGACTEAQARSKAHWRRDA